MKPTQRYGKIRRLVRENKARVVRRWPYTAQLDHDTPDIVQPVTLGIDPGYRYTGLSATTEDKALFEAVAENRTDISKLLATRRELRRSRRPVTASRGFWAASGARARAGYRHPSDRSWRFT